MGRNTFTFDTGDNPNLASLTTNLDVKIDVDQSPVQNQNHNQTHARARKTSLVSNGSPVHFHRPFTPWQVVNLPQISTHGESVPALPAADFRSSQAKWGRGRESVVTTASSSAALGGWRRTRKSKIVGRLNVVVVGAKGIGKTSFIQLLLRSLTEGSHSDHRTTIAAAAPEAASASSHCTSPPQISTHGQDPSPTTRLSSRTITVDRVNYDHTQLCLLDTPGLAMDTDAVSTKERERGVNGLLRMMEDRFGKVMHEEARIVRKATKGEDELVHLVIYLIDARTILRSVVETGPADWSCVGVFDKFEPLETDTLATFDIQPRLSEVQVDTIRQLSVRANVLPVLAYADALTSAELDIVQSAVRRDLASLDGGGFGIFAEEEEDDLDEVVTPDTTISGDDADSEPNPPTSVDLSEPPKQINHKLPFAIFSPGTWTPGDKSFVRRYAWGVADVLDPKQSDFVPLRDEILGTQTKQLRTSTREVLYERYRTEKMLAKRGTRVFQV